MHEICVSDGVFLCLSDKIVDTQYLSALALVSVLYNYSYRFPRLPSPYLDKSPYLLYNVIILIYCEETLCLMRLINPYAVHPGGC